MNTEDSVTKRDGKTENISFDKILKRLKALGKNELSVNYTSLVQKVIDRLYDKISTSLIDELTAQQCASLATTHPDYGVLASRILISNHHKNTHDDILNVATQLFEFKDVHGVHHPIISREQHKVILDHHEEIQAMIDYDRDYYIDYFGFKTLELTK